MQKNLTQTIPVQYHSGNITFCHLFSHAKLCRQESSEEQVGLGMHFFLWGCISLGWQVDACAQGFAYMRH